MKFNRRRFLRHGVALSLGLAAVPGLRAIGRAAAQADPQAQPDALELTGHYRPVHDPCIIKESDTYYLFCTGSGIPWRSSSDLMEWELRGDVFSQIPAWAHDEIPNADSIWAPDISYFNGRYHLYYSVSTFGSNRSRIGLATTPTLDPLSSDYEWTDHGEVVRSQPPDFFNAIDPNLIVDEDGQPWLAFGSFWGGIKMRRIDFETGLPSADDDELYALAQRPAPDALEAAFIIRRESWYYLFASYDFCCRGFTSTYHVKVGRSEQVTGPYVDRDGVPMLEDGGTQVTFPTARWRGPGHNAVLQDETGDYLVYHAYDAQLNGLPTLRISPITWDDDGWLSIDAEA